MSKFSVERSNLENVYFILLGEFPEFGLEGYQKSMESLKDYVQEIPVGQARRRAIYLKKDGTVEETEAWIKRFEDAGKNPRIQIVSELRGGHCFYQGTLNFSSIYETPKHPRGSFFIHI